VQVVLETGLPTTHNTKPTWKVKTPLSKKLIFNTTSMSSFKNAAFAVLNKVDS